jgi:hypothetical protein
MRIWLALIVAPILALSSQSIALGLTHWACEHQNVGVMHAVHIGFLGTTLTCAGLAWLQALASADVRAREARQRQRFLAGLATASAVLSSVVIAAMWVPTWMLSPCIA